MALNFNNFNPKKILYNGLNVAKVIYNGVVVWLQAILTTISGIPPLTLLNVFYSEEEEKYTQLVDYKIYGKSEQEGEPTPDTPIEIQSVGEKTINLADQANVFRSSASWPYPNATPNGYVLDNSINRISQIPCKLEKDKTYICNWEEERITGELNVQLYLKSADKELQYINKNSSFVTKFDAVTIGIYVQYSEGETNPNTGEIIPLNQIKISEVMVNEGSTALPYEPYGYKIPIRVSGSNLFDSNDKYNSISVYEVDEDGWIRMTYDNSTGTSTVWRQMYTKPSEKIKPSTSYRLIVEIEEISNCNLTPTTSNTTYNTGQFKTGIYLNDTGVHVSTITSREDLSVAKTMLRTELVVPAGEIGSAKFRISVLEDTSVTANTFEYEKYIEPVTTNIYLDEPLRKIGDYADYIDFENLKVTRKIKEKAFNGEETFSYYSTAQGSLFRINLSDSISDSKENISLCNMYKVVNQGYRTNNTLSGVSTMYDFINDNYTSASEFKEYLKTLYEEGNSLKLYYALLTSEEKTIELPTIPTHEGTNIIEVDTTIAPSNMEIQYYAKGVA